MINTDKIESILKSHLDLCLPHHSVAEVYQYACIPGGKFFRPSLVWSILSDLNPELFNTSQHSKSDHAFLSSAVECHHTYTLLHDDLPCMDDDVERRGKPCTHIKYGEWQALLAGDGLLNISYQLIGKMKNQRSHELLRFFSWACGPKGLIMGQVMDLSHEMTKSFKNTLRTHELKTARLIQVAILGSAILAGQSSSKIMEKNLWKYSSLLGINFQLIDDLTELVSATLTQHERDVNPWLKFPDETFKATLASLEKFEKISSELKLPNTNLIVIEYYRKMVGILEKDLEQVEKHSGLKLAPIILLIKRFR